VSTPIAAAGGGAQVSPPAAFARCSFMALHLFKVKKVKKDSKVME